MYDLEDNKMCQRPKRAFLISTDKRETLQKYPVGMCQRPKRAFLISTLSALAF